MSMTTRNFGGQNNRARRDSVDDVSDPESPNYDPTDPDFDPNWEEHSKRSMGANDTPADGFDPTAILTNADTNISTLKAAASTSKVVDKNDYKNTQEG